MKKKEISNSINKNGKEVELSINNEKKPTNASICENASTQ
jgi:hypothetical protein